MLEVVADEGDVLFLTDIVEDFSCCLVTLCCELLFLLGQFCTACWCHDELTNVLDGNGQVRHLTDRLKDFAQTLEHLVVECRLLRLFGHLGRQEPRISANCVKVFLETLEQRLDDALIGAIHLQSTQLYKMTEEIVLSDWPRNLNTLLSDSFGKAKRL